MKSFETLRRILDGNEYIKNRTTDSIIESINAIIECEPPLRKTDYKLALDVKHEYACILRGTYGVRTTDRQPLYSSIYLEGDIVAPLVDLINDTDMCGEHAERIVKILDSAIIKDFDIK